jgi:hypothetical protein
MKKEIKDCENKTIREIIQENILPEIEKKSNSEKEKRIKERTPEKWSELVEILKKEHTETFKDITLEAQLDKFVDEQQEFINADNCLEEARELADMIIVAAGIARFAPRFVDEVIHPYIQRKIGDEEKINSVICYMALEKSLINKKRKWKKLSTVNGVKYQHE